MSTHFHDAGTGNYTGLIHDILNSPVPVLTYVHPRGGIAASAGTFIMLSGHLAAMAPGTTIGAAMPVTMQPGGEGQQKAGEKTIKFLAGHMRNIAGERGRPSELTKQDMSFRQQVSSFINNPQVAFILMLPVEPLLPGGWYREFIITVLGMVAVTVAFFILVITKLIASSRRPPAHADFGMKDFGGIATEDLNPDGLIKIRSEWWRAKSAGGEVIPKESRVTVRDKDGMVLIVAKKENESPE